MNDPESANYRIEKLRYPVVLTLLGGERLPGDMFVQANVPFRERPEEPSDVLNAAEAYFPLATADGETLLVAKDQVAEVEAVDPEAAILEISGESPFRLGLRPAVVELTLASGAVRGGALFIEQPADRSRLLDHLNRLSDRFLTLRSTEGMRLINRRLIACVRSLD